jgi:hypothetical protein
MRGLSRREKNKREKRGGRHWSGRRDYGGTPYPLEQVYFSHPPPWRLFSPLSYENKDRRLSARRDYTRILKKQKE